MKNLIVVIVLLVGFKVSQEDQSLPELRSVNAYSVRYVKLVKLTYGIFSAPPLAILDIKTLSRQACFKNFRSSRFALGIPIIFWNSTYMDDLNSQKSSIVGISRNIVGIIPPSNILMFQINWRRPQFYSYRILLDSSWYNSDLNYVLPMSHTFIMEFNDGNSSKQLCDDVRNDLITEPAQRQELEIKFVKKEFGYKKIPEIKITADDINTIEPIKSRCRSPYFYFSCFVYLDTINNVSNVVANNAMQKSGLQGLQWQKQLANLVTEYLCKTQYTYGSIFNNVFGTANYINNQTVVCSVPSEVYSTYATSDRILVGLNSSNIDRGQEEFSISLLNVF